MQHIFVAILLIVSVAPLSFFHTQFTVDEAYLKTFRQAELDRHNQYRAKHGSPLIKLSDSLNQAAQAYADQLKRQAKGINHSPQAKSGKYG